MHVGVEGQRGMQLHEGLEGHRCAIARGCGRTWVCKCTRVWKDTGVCDCTWVWKDMGRANAQGCGRTQGCDFTWVWKDTGACNCTSMHRGTRTQPWRSAATQADVQHYGDDVQRRARVKHEGFAREGTEQHKCALCHHRVHHCVCATTPRCAPPPGPTATELPPPTVTHARANPATRIAVQR